MYDVWAGSISFETPKRILTLQKGIMPHHGSISESQWNMFCKCFNTLLITPLISIMSSTWWGEIWYCRIAKAGLEQYPWLSVEDFLCIRQISDEEGLDSPALQI